MRLVYLITAYKDPPQLKRLINSLNVANSAFYIHVDKKVNIRDFKELISEVNVKFIDKRYHIYWGDYSQVKSIVALIGTMIKENDKGIDRVILISGQDYPIIANNEILEIFTRNPNKQFMIGYNITRAASEHQYKITKYHFLDFKSLLVRYILERIYRLIFSYKPTQVYFDGKYNDVFFGSDYWALSYECVEYAYNVFLKEQSLRRYFRRAFVPSELFMHTIVFNSRFSVGAQICTPANYKGLYTCTPLHYIVYRDEIKVFREEDYETLISSNKMFFRKASTDFSSKLLDKIDVWRYSKTKCDKDDLLYTD